MFLMLKCHRWVRCLQQEQDTEVACSKESCRNARSAAALPGSCPLLCFLQVTTLMGPQRKKCKWFLLSKSLQQRIILPHTEAQQTHFPGNTPPQAAAQNISLTTARTTTVKRSMFTYSISRAPCYPSAILQTKIWLDVKLLTHDQTPDQYVVKMALKATSVFSTLSDAFPLSMTGGTIYVPGPIIGDRDREMKNPTNTTQKRSPTSEFSEGSCSILQL